MVDTPLGFGALASFEDEFFPVSRITAGALGEPGHRVFILQIHIGAEPFSWVIEKDHALALSRAIPALLADVRSEFPELGEPLVAAAPNLELSHPLDPIFRVGSLGVGYDRMHDMIVLTLVDSQLLRDDIEQDADEPQEQSIYTTRGQALLLSRQAEQAVAAGRALCPGCGEPIDEFGHFCLPLTARQRRAGEYLH